MIDGDRRVPRFLGPEHEVPLRDKHAEALSPLSSRASNPGRARRDGAVRPAGGRAGAWFG